MSGKSGAIIRVYGIVQGVGFRPYVLRMAKKYNLVGHVKNCGGYVEILAAPAGAQEADSLRFFLHDLSVSPPEGSAVLHVESTPCTVDADGFSILASTPDEASPVMLPPDFAVCDKCLEELKDASNRRNNHPFISCTTCGARYSVMRSVPYDRESTTMASFPLCAECGREYNSPSDRRHWSQTTCCNACGPRLFMGELRDMPAIDKAAQLINSGGIVAVKGIGGYHLACSAFDEGALKRLRNGKKRDDKPFAVMFPNMEILREFCVCDEPEAQLLQSSARPIVLLSKGEKALHPLVSKQSPYIGAFLPCAAHQYLLSERTGALVMTSGNLSGAPIATSASQLDGLDIDAILDNDREIIAPLDDSVIRPTKCGASFIRRSRGYVPLPSYVPSALPEALATGGDLKAVFGIRRGDWCYLSQHLGDLEELENQALFERQLSHMLSLLQAKPECVICDMHPSYFSSKIAQSLGLPITRIQHHFAHTLAVMGENHINEPVIGVSLDGTGYGEDGAIWGFELLECTRSYFIRHGHLKYGKMPSSDMAMKNAKLAAMSSLISCGMQSAVFEDSMELRTLTAAHEMNINTHLSSSAGRMFDACAYILGCGDYNRFEGQCPQALEYLAQSACDKPSFTMAVEDSPNGFVLNPAPLWDAVISRRSSPAEAAYGFHHGIAHGILKGCVRIRDMRGISKVCLSGGVFQNALLLELTSALLSEHGFEVHRSTGYPSGDASLALGQLSYIPKS